LVLHIVKISAGLVDVATDRTALIRNTAAPERIEKRNHRGVHIRRTVAMGELRIRVLILLINLTLVHVVR
jgi:hypothetical protein